MNAQMKNVADIFGIEMGDEGEMPEARGFRFIMATPNGADELEKPVEQMQLHELVKQDEIKQFTVQVKRSEIEACEFRERNLPEEERGCLGDLKITEDGFNSRFVEREFKDSDPELCGYKFMDPSWNRLFDEVVPEYHDVSKAVYDKLNVEWLKRMKTMREENFFYLASRLCLAVMRQDRMEVEKYRKLAMDTRDSSFEMQSIMKHMPQLVNIPSTREKRAAILKLRPKDPIRVRFEQSRKLTYRQLDVLLKLSETAHDAVKRGKRRVEFPTLPGEEQPKAAAKTKVNLDDLIQEYQIDILRQKWAEFHNNMMLCKQQGDLMGELQYSSALEDVKKKAKKFQAA